MTATARKVRQAAAKVAPELAAASLVSKPKPGTSAWLRAQQEAREAREAAELATYRAGGTDEDAAQAARKVAGRDCEFPGGCAEEPIWEGLLQVANPSAEHPEGVQRNVRVCNYHSARWSSLWGCWPLANNERATEIAEAHEADRRRAEQAGERMAAELAEVSEASWAQPGTTAFCETDGYDGNVIVTRRYTEDGQRMATVTPAPGFPSFWDDQDELDVDVRDLSPLS